MSKFIQKFLLLSCILGMVLMIFIIISNPYHQRLICFSIIKKTHLNTKDQTKSFEISLTSVWSFVFYILIDLHDYLSAISIMTLAARVRGRMMDFPVASLKKCFISWVYPIQSRTTKSPRVSPTLSLIKRISFIPS